MSEKKIAHPNNISLSVELPRRVGYIDCALHTPVCFTLTNRGEENAALSLIAESGEGLILRYEAEVEVPFGRTVKLAVPDLFSPLFLAKRGKPRRAFVTARVFAEGRELARGEASAEALSCGMWEGTEGNAERLAAFVRPQGEGVAPVAAAMERAARRTEGTEDPIKEGEVRRMLAAMFDALISLAPACTEANATAPLEALGDAVALRAPANFLQLAVFACSCMEAAGMRPLLAVGERRVGVGAWLYDTSLLSPSTDDAAIVREYLAGEAESLACYDLAELIAGKGAPAAKRRFLRGLKEGEYRTFVDIFRCRKEGIPPCPFGEDAAEAKPLPPRQAARAPFQGRLWERRLLDFSARNRLLRFTGKHMLRILCEDPDRLIASLAAEGGMRLVAGGAAHGGAGQRALVRLEAEKGLLHVCAEREEAEEEAARLMRADRASAEETGANVLYLSFGLLHFSVGKERSDAPVALLPVTLSRTGADGAFALRAAGEFFLNSTLLEYLRLKTPSGEPLAEAAYASLADAMEAVEGAAQGEDRHVTGEVFLGTFCFRNYYLWHDLRRNFGEFCKNETVRALLRGRMEPRALPAPSAAPLRLPLPSDASQEEAIALSDTGATFALHGPPGTGKSQTIANLIAHALRGGKRVLFVAEKKAALDVVYRRLARVGIADFCLQLTADRVQKSEVAAQIAKTLSLFGETDGEGDAEAFSRCEEAEGRLKEALAALHQKTAAGITVCDALARCIFRADVAEFAGGREAFYAGMDAERLALCRHALAGAEEAFKRCRALRGAPFEHVDTVYSEGIRARIVCASQALLLSAKHLKESLSLFASFYCQPVPALTAPRLTALLHLARRLESGTDAVYFDGASAEELGDFCEADAALERLQAAFFHRFRTQPAVPDEAALLRYGREGGDWRLDLSLRAAAKRLARAAREELSEEDIPKFLKTLSDILANVHKLEASPFAIRYCDRAGKLREERREAFARGIRSLHALCTEAFGAYERGAFYAACIRARGGVARPILAEFCSAAEAFLTAFHAFCAATGTNLRRTEGEDLLAYGTEKAAALLDHIDMLREWCRCKETVHRLEEAGAGAVMAALEGDACPHGAAASLEKGVWRRIVENYVAKTPALSQFTSQTLEEMANGLKAAEEAMRAQTCKTLRDFLISRLSQNWPSAETGALHRAERGGTKHGVRTLFAEIPTLLARACPCLLMSPWAVAQYLPPQANAFDLVIFDEASQMSTAEAVGCIARAKAAIVVGDPNQLPPTEFFRATPFGEEEEDAESVLDDFLALGVPERHLRWHYRSRHESLISFSNAAFYGNALRTVPSPDASRSRVKFFRVNGIYDRGGSKRNRAEAEALVAEIVRRLSDPVLSKASMGVVTFSVAQREEIERLLAASLAKGKLEEAAYAREEPLFVKNLENVQGDERDVILFSVCYGADASGRLSLNFGPLNRTGGWRRLNVAASRAREEMLVYASLSASAIDADRTASRGVLALRAFLEFAETGKMLLVPGTSGTQTCDVAEHIARALKRCGYPCRRNVGASACKVDVAVEDPRDRSRYLLAILCDGPADMPVRDGILLKERLLERAGWAVLRVSSVGYYANPVRELERIKRALDGRTGGSKRMARYARAYRFVAASGREPASFITDARNAGAVSERLAEIVAREQPISRAFLKKRCLESFGITSHGAGVSAALDRLIDGCAFLHDRVHGVDYFYRNKRALAFTRYRVEGRTPLRKSAEDFTVYEVVSMVRGALEDNVSLYADEVGALFEREFRTVRAEGELAAFLLRCVAYGEEKGLFRRSASDRLSLIS